MKALVVIGGGEISQFSTLAIDTHIVQLTGKQAPKALFIPTASGDSEDYFNAFKATYVDRLGCEAKALRLITEQPSIQEMEEVILSSDLIYIGGGDTLKLITTWDHLGIYGILLNAYEKGIVIAGISAGATCWFQSGVRFEKYENENEPCFSQIESFGLIDAFLCPHFNQQERAKQYLTMMNDYDGIGIGLEDNCAIEFIDSRYRVIVSQEDATAYKVIKKNGVIKKEQILKSEEYATLQELLTV